jgi:catechol 2,3-dioxygenase-like lactoylglutathione lyase family enzyme
MLFDHVDMRVKNLALVRPLYDALLPAMGYSRINADEESAGYHRPDETGAEPFIWLVQDPEHQPSGIRVGLAAPSRGEVDRLAAIARAAGARAFEAPELITEYGPAYYAAFFEDAEGNKLEICCRRRTAQ